MTGKFKRVKEQGVTFVFKYDDDAPSMLHIYARHLTEIDDALDVWFEADATEHFNQARNRYERTGSRHALWWYWIDQNQKVVMVITCFTR